MGNNQNTTPKHRSPQERGISETSLYLEKKSLAMMRIQSMASESRPYSSLPADLLPFITEEEYNRIVTEKKINLEISTLARQLTPYENLPVSYRDQVDQKIYESMLNEERELDRRYREIKDEKYRGNRILGEVAQIHTCTNNITLGEPDGTYIIPMYPRQENPDVIFHSLQALYFSGTKPLQIYRRLLNIYPSNTVEVKNLCENWHNFCNASVELMNHLKTKNIDKKTILTCINKVDSYTYPTDYDKDYYRTLYRDTLQKFACLDLSYQELPILFKSIYTQGEYKRVYDSEPCKENRLRRQQKARDIIISTHYQKITQETDQYMDIQCQIGGLDPDLQVDRVYTGRGKGNNIDESSEQPEKKSPSTPLDQIKYMLKILYDQKNRKDQDEYKKCLQECKGFLIGEFYGDKIEKDHNLVLTGLGFLHGLLEDSDSDTGEIVSGLDCLTRAIAENDEFSPYAMVCLALEYRKSDDENKLKESSDLFHRAIQQKNAYAMYFMGKIVYEVSRDVPDDFLLYESVFYGCPLFSEWSVPLSGLSRYLSEKFAELQEYIHRPGNSGYFVVKEDFEINRSKK